MSENATVLISLALQNNRQEWDLQVPTDKFIGYLLPFFQELCKGWVPHENILTYDQVWVRTFDRSGARQLELGQTLSEEGIRDGDNLELVQASGQTSNQGAGPESQPKELFHIPPRTYPAPPAVEAEIVIPLPPKKPQQQGTLVSILQKFLPIIGAASGSLFFVFYVISDRSNPLLLVIALVVALIGILTGFFTGWIQRRTLKENQERARKAYRNHLNVLSKQLNEKATKQHEYLQRLFPPDQQNLFEIARQGTQLWVRRIHEPDFMQVSIGQGKVDLYPSVSLQPKSDYLADYNQDDLQEQENLLKKSKNLLTQEPIVLNLRSVGVLTLVGERARTRSLARALLSQLVVFHSPQDLRCLVFFPPEASNEWSWLKWLPHTRLLRASNGAEEAQEPFALLARQAEELRYLLEKQVKSILTQRREQRHTQVPSQPQSHLLMLIDGLTLNSPVGELLMDPSMTTLLNEAAASALTVLCLVDNLRDEPRQTKARITWTSTQVETLTFQEIKQAGMEWKDITPRTADVASSYKIARSLAARKLAGVEEHAADLSRNFGLLDLLKLPPNADMHTIRRWREYRQIEPNSLLRVPVGRNEQGKLVYLDLKELADRGDGPHGLLVGKSGSGKSELLRTLILSLAIQHDIQTLNFVFIDFKGDATFTELKHLPHNAGLITNLKYGPGLFERVLDSLEGEITRRQQLFSQVKAKDIREYRQRQQESLRSEKPLVALPYLLLVVDEAAELLKNEPHGQAFRELFISIGRVGRSLGIHLLLATQKIEGSSFRGLESYLRYRLCLHTSTTDESDTVLGRPDAFYLPSTPGVGYLKVDSGELQKLKAALVSQPLVIPQQGDLAKRIRRFTSTGSLTPIPGLPTTSPASSAPQEEIQVILDLLLELSKNAPRAYRVWLDPLPPTLGLRGLEQWLGSDLSHPLNLWRKEVPGTLQVSVGLVDLPEQQKQELLTLDFTRGDGHLALVGAPQRGKSTSLRSLLMALMLTHAPSEVQIYIIDLAGGQFHKYEPLPHIGAVCLPSQDEELRLTLRLMEQIIADRTALFRQEHFSTMTDFRQKRQAGQYSGFAYGDVFLVIDNVAPFKQDVDLGGKLGQILQHGPNAGVHLILTANSWNDLRPAFWNLIGKNLELRLNDPSGSRINSKLAGALPGNAPSTKTIPGRGLTSDQVQFQVSQPWIEHFSTVSKEPEEATLNYLKDQATKWSGSRAKKLPKLPFPIEISKIREMGGYGLLLGLQDFTLKRYYLNLFEEGPHFQIWGDTNSGKTTLLKVCLEELQRYPSTNVKIGVIENRAVGQPLYQSVQAPYLLTRAWIRDPDALKKSLSLLKEHVQPRLQMNPDQAAREPVQTHYVLLVDGYDPSLVKDPKNAMEMAEWTELVTWAERGEEIGFHLILTGSYAVANSMDKLVKALKAASPGLLLHASTLPGKILYEQSPTVQPHPGRGFLVRPGKGRQLIQTALPTKGTNYQ